MQTNESFYEKLPGFAIQIVRLPASCKGEQVEKLLLLKSRDLDPKAPNTTKLHYPETSRIEDQLDQRCNLESAVVSHYFSCSLVYGLLQRTKKHFMGVSQQIISIMPTSPFPGIHLVFPLPSPSRRASLPHTKTLNPKC